MTEKDIIIIGGGPGGYVAAIRAAQLGARVSLVEKEELGGICLNWGCIPTKVLLHAVEILESLRKAKDFGIQVGEVKVDFMKSMARKDQIVKTLVAGVYGLMRSNRIEVIKGKGSLVSAREVEVINDEGERIGFRANKVILATGSVSGDLPLFGNKISGVIDSHGALKLNHVPESIVVVGGGSVGLEFGTIYAALGSKVTILEMMPQILPQEDAEIASALERALKQFNIRIFTNCQVKEIREVESKKRVIGIVDKKEERGFEGQYVLIAVGRKANLEGLGVERIGIKLNEKGIEVNEKMETNVPGVYAVGDVTGQVLLAHYAMAQGRVAAENALGREASLNRRVVPRCVYTLPEVASVGMTEEEAKNAGYELKIGRFPFAANGKATAMGERNGLIKVIADKKYGEILGVHIFGPHATDLIGEAILAMSLESTPTELTWAIHPHPTLSEALMEAFLDVDASAIHIPPRK